MVLMECLVHQVQLVKQDRKVLRVFQVFKDYPVQLVHKVLLVQLVQLAEPVRKVQQDLQVAVQFLVTAVERSSYVVALQRCK
jgi:hypothetical protein